MTKTKVVCPACGGPSQLVDNPYRPFCSEMCQKRDLGDWASERYRVPTLHGGPSDDDEKPE